MERYLNRSLTIQMSSIITLTTDFGTKDGYVGAMKGKILSISPTTNIIDISHKIPPQSIIQASFCLLRSIPQYPNHSIHVAVIDPGVGSDRSALLIKTKKWWLIGPDNGVFSLLLEQFPSEKIIQVFPKTKHWETHQSFDGLALFSSVAAHLAKGMKIEKIGQEIKVMKKLTIAKSKITHNGVEGEIILFDHFGNAITNIDSANLQYSRIQIVLISEGKRIHCKFKSHYQEGGSAEVIAIINSDQLLELSIFNGSVQKRLRLSVGDKIQVMNS